MLKLVMLMLLAQPITGGVPERLTLRDPSQGPTPVMDKYMIPGKPADCRNEAEVQRALAQLRESGTADCFIRDIRAFRRR